MLKIEKTSVYGFEEAIRGMRNPMNSWDKSDSGICKGGDDGIGCSNCAAFGCQHSYDHSFQLGVNDFELMTKLRNAGTDHRKFMRMITVYVDITAPLYWWKEFDTYKVGTVANSCSTMHKIAEKEFTLEDFSHEHLFLENSSGQFVLNGTNIKVGGISLLNLTVNILNGYRNAFLEEKDTDNKKLFWWQMIQLLPSSYNQKRTVLLNYEVLANVYKSRCNHKLDEWCLHKEVMPEIDSTSQAKYAKPYKEVIGFCDWIETLPYSELITGKEKI